MIRTCDGTDSTLVAPDGRTPCSCGTTFDDVQRMVVYPHRPVRPRPERPHPHCLCCGATEGEMVLSDMPGGFMVMLCRDCSDFTSLGAASEC